MKLHLPKLLLTAVLAACASTVFAKGASGWNKDGGGTFYISTEGPHTIDATGVNYTNWNIWSDSGAANNAPTLATVDSIKFKNNDTADIELGQWADSRYFDTITIKTISVAGDGSATLNVRSGNKASIINTSGGSLNINNAGTLTLGATTENTINLAGTLVNTGELTIKGTLKVSDLSGFTTAIIGGELSDTVNGYRTGDEAHLIISGSETSTINKDEATFDITGKTADDLLWGGNQLSVKTGKTVTGTTYEIHDTAEAVVYDSAAEKWASATEIQMYAGTKLQLQTALADSVSDGITVKGANSIIELTKGVEHSHSKVTTEEGQKVSYTLDGAVLNISATTTNISAITLTNKSTVKMPSAATSLGTADSLVQISMSGDSALSMENGSNGNVYAEITIDGAAKLLGSYQGNNLNVRGTISGSGVLTLAKPEEGKNNSWTISSTISDKSDTEKLAIVHTANTVTLSGNNSYSGGTTITGGLVKATHANALGTGSVTVNGGKLEATGQHAIEGKELNISNGTVFIEHNAGASESSAIHKDTDVSIGAGGTLHIKGHDSMGWGQAGSKVAVKSIQLKGTADNKATLKLEEQGEWDGKNSIGYGLDMQGYSDVIGIGGNNIIDGASVTASNTGNTITFEKLQISKDWNVTVAEDGELAISSTSTDANKTGHIVKKGAGALTLSGTYTNALDLEAGTVSVSGKLTGNVTVTGGKLTVSSGDAISGSTLSITNGIVNIYANNDSAIGPNTAVSILAGGTLNASGHDMFHYNADALSSISLKGEKDENEQVKMATLHIDDYQMENGNRKDTSCTMTTQLNMQGYSQVTGNSINTYAMDTEGVTNTGVQVSGKNNVIATDDVQLRSNWVLDVTKNAELEVSSVIKDGVDRNGKLMKKGDGTLILSGTNTQTRGTVIDAGTIIADNDKAMGGGAVTINKGTLQVGVGEADSKDVNLSITGGLSLTQTSDASKVALSEGSSLTMGSVKFTGGKKDGSVYRVEDGSHGATYGVGNASYIIENAAVEVNSTSNNTMYNRLMGVALSNTGTGVLTAGNGNNNLTELQALAGDINLTWYNGQKNQGTISNLTIATERTVSAYEGNSASNKATITASGLTVGTKANLNANLTLTNGAILTLDGALAMNAGTLTLGESLTLDAATLQKVLGLQDGGTLDLFTNVSSFVLGDMTYTKGTDILDANSNIDLEKWFTLTNREVVEAIDAAADTPTNLGGGYYLGYDANGTVFVGMMVPEPTTATLSLLALAGLAARRRRK